MPGLKLIASARPVQTLGAPDLLTFELPELAIKGHLLVLLVVRDPATALASPGAHWTAGPTTGGGTATIETWLRLVDDDEAQTIVVSNAGVDKELHGQLLVFANGTPGAVSEAIGNAAFAADATPDAPFVARQQAANFELCVWQATTAVDLEPPAGMTVIDDYSTALVAARTTLFAYQVSGYSGAGGTGLIATSAPASTGRAFTWILRDRAPITPVELVDDVPGHIGLIGRDNRIGR